MQGTGKRPKESKHLRENGVRIVRGRMGYPVFPEACVMWLQVCVKILAVYTAEAAGLD